MAGKYKTEINSKQTIPGNKFSGSGILLAPLVFVFILFSVQPAFSAEKHSRITNIYFSKWQAAESSNGYIQCNLYLQIDPTSLSATQQPIHKLSVSATIFNKLGVALTTSHQSCSAEMLHTRNSHRTSFYLASSSYNLKPGDYYVIFSIQGSENLEMIHQESFTITAQPAGRTCISDILCAANIGINDQEIKPFPARVFGKFQKKLYSFIEFSNIDAREEIHHYQLQLINPKQQTVAEIRSNLESKNRYSLLDSINTEHLHPGTHTLKYGIFDKNEQKLAERITEVYIHQNPGNPNFFSRSDILNDLQFAMSSEQFEMLVQSQPEHLTHKIEEFWKDLDPSPKTIRNEMREIYYSRLDYVKQNYWQADEPTDRGLTFLQYGCPDKIEQKIDPIKNTTYETWRYRNFNRRIMFRDNEGFGDYRFVILANAAN